MKQFVRNLFLFATACLVLSLIIILTEHGIINRQGRFKLSNVKKYIFLGHSHAQMAYDDKIIDSSINQSSSGEAYFYTYIKLNKILESNREKKIVFIEYSNNNIVPEMNDWIWDDMHVLDRYKLYTAYTHFDELRLLLVKNPRATLLCNIKSMINNIYYILHPKNISTDSMMGGYVYLIRDKTDSLLKARLKNPIKTALDTNISNTNIRYLKKIIELCHKNGVPVYLVRSPLHPMYEGLGNEEKLKELLRSELKGTEFLDFKNFPLKDSDYGDLEHVNYKGAKKYSVFFNKLLEGGLLDSIDKQKYINDQMSVEMRRR
jgi:hypothetical protein